MSKMTADLATALLDEAVDILDSEADCPDGDSGPVLRYVRDMLRSVREHLIETDEQRRERFESWCTFRGFSTERHRTGPYLANVTQAAWYAWQAALTWRGETKGGEA